jgi:acyl-CoA thioesterase I
MTYLDNIKTELKKQWPDNRTINLVFHGHSVPSGYFVTPDIRTLDAYPHQLLRELKKIYPYAVINTIVTAIGGETSKSGAERFESDVLNHKPDVLFIDYVLNDRLISLKESKDSWEFMICKTLEKNIKLILLTPSPDEEVDLFDEKSDLALLSNQVKELAKKYDVGLVDSYDIFRRLVKEGGFLHDYMSQQNHPNEKGHSLVTNSILEYFK